MTLEGGGWGGGVASGNSHKGSQLVPEMTLLLGSAPVALVQGLTPMTLGWDSTGNR